MKELQLPMLNELLTMVESTPQIKVLIQKSIDKAAEINPDPKTNPVRTFEDYCGFIEWCSFCDPWDIIGTFRAPGLYEKIDQGLSYFYYLLDQPLEELENHGYFYPCLEFFEPIAEWCKRYTERWGLFLSTPSSWNDDYYNIALKDERFGMNKGWYSDKNIWKTFNDFFIRKLISPDVRPISDAPLVSPADSTPQGCWNIDDLGFVKQTLSIKSAEINSVMTLIGTDSKYYDKFAGGSLTHTFLDVNDYHRYHFPMSGKVLEVEKIPGYTAGGGICVWDKENKRYKLMSTDVNWQMLEIRGRIILETEYGLVAILPIGMSQVCSINWEDSVKVGAVVKKGDPMGYFLCGGSDIVMVFQKGISLTNIKDEHILMGEKYGDISLK